MPLRVIRNPDKFRENVRNKINEKLGSEKDSANLEKGIFNFVLKEAEYRKIIKKWDNQFFVELYLDHLRSILNNFTEKWVNEIKDGIIKPHQLAFMTHQELNNDKWSVMVEEKSKRDKNKFEMNMESSTDMFTCGKCKGKRCVYSLQQLRSSDEPMTCFITCLDCGKRWKKN